jgi:RNA 2',3'-cyclic 3'-phosphodiesterase
VRLFVALELDEQARRLLGEYQRLLGALNRVVRWVRPEQIHLTLKFLGEVAEQQVPAVAKALDTLAEQPAFDFEMEGVGYFGSARSPRVVWAGVRMPNGPLTRLQRGCEEALSPLGYPPEGRAYSPHLTLGRVKDFRGGEQVVQAVDQLAAEARQPLTQAAMEVTLFESILRPQGSQYATIHKVILGKR